MTAYTITFARADDGEHAQFVMRVEVGESGVTVGELTVRPGSSGGINLGDIPPVDFNLLAQALLGPSAQRDTAADVPTETVPAAASTAVGPAKPRGESRTYRKMPDAAQVLKVLREEGTVVAMAKRFGVPRHTAQGWLARIRRDS